MLINDQNLIDGSRAIKPLVFRERAKQEFERQDRPTDDNVFMRDKYLYGVRARANAGFGLWQLAFGSKAPLTAESYEAARAVQDNSSHCRIILSSPPAGSERTAGDRRPNRYLSRLS